MIVIIYLLAILFLILFSNKPFEKIPIIFGFFIAYIIISAWALHLFNSLFVSYWQILNVFAMIPFFYFIIKKNKWYDIELSNIKKLEIGSIIPSSIIILWICLTLVRIKILPVLGVDGLTMHLLQQMTYFQEGNFYHFPVNFWASGFRPLNGIIWNMFFSTHLQNPDLIEIPQIISWAGLIILSYSIFSELKINRTLSFFGILCIAFSPTILSLSANINLDLITLFFFSGVIYFGIKIQNSQRISILELISFGIFCGALLGARVQGIIIMPLYFSFYCYILHLKNKLTWFNIIIPLIIALCLGSGKYILNYNYYQSPVPLGINKTNSISITNFQINLMQILPHNILERPWSLTNLRSDGWPLNFLIIPFSFFGLFLKRFRSLSFPTYPLFLIGLIFLFISMSSYLLSPIYTPRLWLPFTYASFIYGMHVLAILVKEKKVKYILITFLIFLIFSILLYGGIYRLILSILLATLIIYIYLYKNTLFDQIGKFILLFTCVISIWYATVNIIYDKRSPIFRYKEINHTIKSHTLSKLSKIFNSGSHIGYFNNPSKNERIFLHYLFGEMNDIHARLIFDWNDKINIHALDNLLSKRSYDYIIINENDYPIYKDGLKRFKIDKKFENYFILKDKTKFSIN
ncbi:MAG: hypothetical protein CMG55_07180 [Candidatus Marinimicrobia bacterium]|nr:hypothetical protein [Candidatus Neomarinimicrobiota bacterium]